MRKTFPICLAVAGAAFFLAVKSFAQSTNEAADNATSNEVAINTATNPVPRDAAWVARHEQFVAQARKGGVNLLFMGDSITDNWRNRGSNVWNKYYAPRHAANFGIGGDRTEHVLWRLEHGELDGIHPKVIVLMIGTNNTGPKGNSAPEIIQAVQAIVAELRARLPRSKILLLAIFPRSTMQDPRRAQVALINTVIAKLDDGKMVRYLDIDPNFIEADGTLPRSIMSDLLHPTAEGYQIWAAAMEPTLKRLLK